MTHKRDLHACSVTIKKERSQSKMTDTMNESTRSRSCINSSVMMKQDEEHAVPQKKKKSITKVSFSEESDNQVYRIPRLSFSRRSDCFYNEDELADFRYDAFLIQAGIVDPDEDDDDDELGGYHGQDNDKNRNGGAAPFDVSSSTIDTTVSDLTMSLSSLTYQHLDDDECEVEDGDDKKQGHKEEVKEDHLPKAMKAKQQQVLVCKKNKDLDHAEDDTATVATVSTSSSWSTRRSEKVTSKAKTGRSKNYNKNESDRPRIARRIRRKLSSWKGPTTNQSQRSSGSRTSSSSSSASARTTSTASHSTSSSSTRKKPKSDASKSAHTDCGSTNMTLKARSSHKDPHLPRDVVVGNNKICKEPTSSISKKAAARSSIIPTSSWKMVVKTPVSKAPAEEEKKKMMTTTTKKHEVSSKPRSYLKKRISSSWKMIEPEEPFTTMDCTASPSKVINFKKDNRSETSEKAGPSVARAATRKSGGTIGAAESPPSSTDTPSPNKKSAWQLREEAKRRKHRLSTRDDKFSSRGNKLVKQ